MSVDPAAEPAGRYPARHAAAGVDRSNAVDAPDASVASAAQVEPAELVEPVLPLPLVSDPAGPLRVGWLDGVRACAALFVVAHHVYLSTYPGYPHVTGPAFLGWLLYGHLAVVVFIVVSGYSLCLQPLRHGNRLPGGSRGFARRRFWRIVPPYWVALVFSMAMVIVLLARKGEAAVGAKTFAVHALLLQDVIGSPSPNGAFWSIAVEAQIYILFPLLLWMVRRRGSVMMALVVSVLVCLADVLATHVHTFERIENFTPQLLVAFVFGMAVAQRTHVPKVRGRRLPLFALAAVGAVAVVVAFNRIGSVVVVREFFWADIAVGLVVAVAFWALTANGVSLLGRVLSSRPLAVLGSFSYSIYLIHYPIVLFFWYYLVKPLHLGRLASFALLGGVGVPLVVGAAYLFFLAFERPFLRIRSFAALRAHYLRRSGPTTRPGQPRTAEHGGDPAPVGLDAV